MKPTLADYEAWTLGDESPLVALVKEKEDLLRQLRQNERQQRKLLLAQIGESNEKR